MPSKTSLESKCDQIVEALDTAHAAYYRKEVFGGPCLHFHLRALQAGKDGECRRFAEAAYALLTAWGMHRMGSGGSKMTEFETFAASLQPLWPSVLKLQQASPANLDDSGWQDLKRIFQGIECMETKTLLVGNSKVMAHALPNLIPPVDREYTLKFLFGTGHITNNKHLEWTKLEMILRRFFYPLIQAEAFKTKAREWLEAQNYRWNTSELKIADNLLIGFVRSSAPTAVAVCE